MKSHVNAVRDTQNYVFKLRDKLRYELRFKVAMIAERFALFLCKSENSYSLSIRLYPSESVSLLCENYGLC